MKILVTGGARSGKSRHAQELATTLHTTRFYLATAEPLDGEMRDRVARHRRQRDETWTTIEVPSDIAPCLRQHGVVLVDCLTLWISNLLGQKGPDANLEAEIETLVQALESTTNPVVLVSNEVGMGLVPDNPLGRRFRDWSGLVNQRVAGAADRVIFMCTGLPLHVK